MKHQIAAFLATQSKTIKLSFVDVLKQSGGYDCGLFVLAFAKAQELQVMGNIFVVTKVSKKNRSKSLANISTFMLR